MRRSYRRTAFVTLIGAFLVFMAFFWRPTIFIAAVLAYTLWHHLF